MYRRKLNITEWKQQVETLVQIVNNQYRQISVDAIVLQWVEYPRGIVAVLRFPSRPTRIVFEGLISGLLQGICFVVDNSTLKWEYA